MSRHLKKKAMEDRRAGRECPVTDFKPKPVVPVVPVMHDLSKYAFGDLYIDQAVAQLSEEMAKSAGMSLNSIVSSMNAPTVQTLTWASNDSSTPPKDLLSQELTPYPAGPYGFSF